MFVGHYGVAFAVKTPRNKIPLWVLFVAVQLLDFLWAPFVLLGIEKVRFRSRNHRDQCARSLLHALHA